MVKESRKFRFQLNTTQEEIYINPEPTKKAKNIKKATTASLEDMKKVRERNHYMENTPISTDIADVDRATANQWLRSSRLKGEPEGFILTAQDQSISTQAYYSRIVNNGVDLNCRLCIERKKAVDRIVSACLTVVNTDYFQRYDRVASFMHWILCKNFNLPHTEKWYEHTLQPVIESTEVTILWDFTINADRKIEANRRDVILKTFEENACIMTDVTLPADKNISLRDFQKLSKYKDLEIEVTKKWKLRTKTIPVITGALCMMRKGTPKFIDQIPGGNAENSTHKCCSHITKSALNVSKYTAISNNIITSKYTPSPVPPLTHTHTHTHTHTQVVRHVTLHLPEVSGKRLSKWLYQTSI